MKIHEILQEKEFYVLNKEIGLFTEKLLSVYIDNLEITINDSGEKEVFDSIWGPVEFNVGEIAILDSPLIQRLRKIKQLGLASYVYCGADYSRFAHTIGVFFLAGEMADILEERLNVRRNRYNFPQIVRLAAIFHDAGHMYFSHVSERFFIENEKFKRYDVVKKALTKFSRCIDDTIDLHELISIIIVNSDYVKKLLLKTIPYLEGISLKNDDDIENITEYISCLILGQANDENLLPYYQIINGPVDADKCDYLSRDSHVTRVPVAVDIFRLIHKLNIEEGDIPEELRGSKLWEGDEKNKVFYPTIKSSAVEALNQLIMARAIMYNSVYYHQKVRTAEIMFRKILENLNEINVEAVTDFTTIMLTTDDAFGYYCFEILSKDIDVNNKTKLKNYVDVLNQINFRFLMKRACLLDEDNIDMSQEKNYDFNKNFFMLYKLDKVAEIEHDTKEEYEIICEKLTKNDKSNRSFLIMEFPKITLSDSIPNAAISYGNGEVKKASEVFQVGTWIESKESKNKEQYLVTDCAYRELAFLAVQKVLFEKYGIILKDTAAVCSKVSPADIKKRKKSLLQKGYYDNCLSLVSEYILDGFEKDIKKIFVKYQTFEGARGSVISNESIKMFLKQFLRFEMSYATGVSLIDGVIRILLSGLFLDRKCFNKSMENILSCFNVDSEKIYLCSLGGEKDSGKHMQYYFNDLDSDRWNLNIFNNLPEVLGNSEKDEIIILFDDGAYSGVQLSSIIEEYMGVPSEQRSTKEKHVKPLTEVQKKKLKDRKIYFAYICFNKEKEDFILEHAKELGMRIDGIKYMYNMEEKVFQRQDFFADEKQRKIVEDCLRQVGMQLLQTTKKINNQYKDGWSEQRVNGGGLGYNDAQQIVVLKSNVPTYTITAFWMENGIFNGEAWIPLFARTDK